MNFQQLSNLQYWSSLFPVPWSITINVLILLISYINLQNQLQNQITILVRGVFSLSWLRLRLIFGLDDYFWLINQLITYGVIAAVVIFSPEIRTNFGTIRSSYGLLFKYSL